MVMDIIGPLRIASYKDNTHILTIVCMCTSWHEAISLRITTFEIVSKAMIMIFFKVRSSKYNPTRNSSQFISQATKLILENLGVHKVFSSMYHPQTNWAVERFNGPLKVMHAKVTAEHPPNWDALLPSVLFLRLEKSLKQVQNFRHLSFCMASFLGYSYVWRKSYYSYVMNC